MNATRLSTRPRRWLRWLVGLFVLTVLLLVYALGLDRLSHRLQTDIQKSMRDVPAVEDAKHRGG